MAWKYHRFCLRLPPTSREVLAEMKTDMRLHGFDPRHPVTMFRGEIVDGRHRQQLVDELKAEGAKIDVTYEEWAPPAEAQSEQDIQLALEAFTKRENALRRSVSLQQWAQMLVIEKKLDDPKKVKNLSDVSEKTGISRAVLSKARTIQQADPELGQQVAAGTVPASVAYQQVRADREAVRVERLASDPESSAIAPTSTAINAEFLKLRKKLSEAITALGRAKLLALNLQKSVGGGEQFLRTLTAAHDDCERWGKFLKEWSQRSGVKS